MIVPHYPNHSTPVPNSEGARDPLDHIRRSASSASARSLPSLPYRASNTLAPALDAQSSINPQVLRKAAPPPIPNKKPSLLSKSSQPGSDPALDSRSLSLNRSDDLRSNEALHHLPSAGRTQAPQAPSARKPVQDLLDGDVKPALPPRTGTGLSSVSNGSRGAGGSKNLMDDEPEELQSLKDWEVLRPGR